jgi:hypothetical protein
MKLHSVFALLALASAAPFVREDRPLSNNEVDDEPKDLMVDTPEEEQEDRFVKPEVLDPSDVCSICIEPLGSNTTALEYCKNRCGKYVHSGKFPRSASKQKIVSESGREPQEIALVSFVVLRGIYFLLTF